METRRDNCPTVRLTFTERHIILMFIIGESPQNLPNIVNSDVIKADWQSVWKRASLLRVYPLCKKKKKNSNSSVETIRSSELNWKDGVEVYFGSKLHQNVVEFLTRGARHVECTEHYSQSGCQGVSGSERRSEPSSQPWKRRPEME